MIHAISIWCICVGGGGDQVVVLLLTSGRVYGVLIMGMNGPLKSYTGTVCTSISSLVRSLQLLLRRNQCWPTMGRLSHQSTLGIPVSHSMLEGSVLEGSAAFVCCWFAVVVGLCIAVCLVSWVGNPAQYSSSCIDTLLYHVLILIVS